MALRSLRKEFGVSVGAGESAIRVNTDEIDDALKTIAEVCKKYGWEMRVWDSTVGTQWWVGDQPAAKDKPPGPVPNPKDPFAILNAAAEKNAASGSNLNALQTVLQFLAEPAKPDKSNKGEVQPVVLVMKNFHLSFDERSRPAMSSAVQHLIGDKVHDHPEYQSKLKKDLYDPHEIPKDSDTGKFLVALMPGEEKVPSEVEPLFKVIDHELPDEAEISVILDGVSAPVENDDEDNTDDLSEEDRKKVCKFALGLTRLQAEGVFSACLVQHEKIVPEYVWQEKSRILNKEGLVRLYMGKEKFKDVAGLDGAKEIMMSLLTHDEFDEYDVDVRAKGALFVGPPGVGKTLIAKATGNEMGYPTLMVNPGSLMGGYVGDTERNTRRMFQIVKAHAPCIAVIDEVEKVMPKSKGGGGDSGVGARMEGTFLTNLNDMEERVFWVFTANDVRSMHEAFFRAERVDAVFYVPLPSQEHRIALWRQYGKKYFPESYVVGKQTIPFPRHIPVSFSDVMEELKKAKKVNPVEWADRFTLSLMALSAVKREAAIEKLKAVNENIVSSLKLIDDDGWSPAEVKACCRLSRRLKEPLRITKKRIRPVSHSAASVIERLEEWAEESALDANTGELYVRPEYATSDDEDEDEEPKSRKKALSDGKKKMRRKVRRINKD